MPQEHPLNRVVCDTTIVDLLVVDKEDRPLTKQRSLLVTRDRFTGCVLAFSLGEQEDKMSKPSSAPSDQGTSSESMF